MGKFFTMTALLVLLSTATATAQWTVKLPQPTGPYQIGTSYFALVDESRPEAFTDDPKDHRELLVRTWYPAQPVPGAVPEPFWGRDTKQIGPLLAQFMRLPKTAFDDLALVQSHAYTDAPLAKSKSSYPVIVFSHGYIPGFISQNTAQMEELASHGYIVFSIGHAYETVANIFPDGRVVPFSQTQLMAFGKGAGKANELVNKYGAATDPVERDALIRRIAAEWRLLDESLRIWTADTSFVLDTLEKMNSGTRKSTFTGKWI